MAKWLKPGQVVSRDPQWNGCLRVRWRKVSASSGGKLITGYLPPGRTRAETDARKAAYDAYERACHDAGEAPQPPEDYFADQISQLRADQACNKDDVIRELEAAGQRSMSLASYVGPEYRDDRIKDGPFWNHTPDDKGRERRQSYFRLTNRWLSAEFVNRPMSELTTSLVIKEFERLLACPKCVDRAVKSGRTPGVDIPWKRLVPRDGVPEFDEAGRCEDHHTEWAGDTYSAQLGRLKTILNSAMSPMAVEEFGQLIVSNPTPKPEFVLSKNIVFKASVQEELRCGLSLAQVELQTEASPPGYEAIPFTAAFTLNRGGQELSGLNVGDFSWTDESRRSGRVHLRNFFSRRDGSFQLSDRGKTLDANRVVFVPKFVAELIERHIRNHRSTPSDHCPACQAGHRHWGGDTMRCDRADNPHRDCDFAADAPLFIRHDTRHRLAPTWYVDVVWHPMNERAGLTQKTLGWKPQLRHSRSTGTTLHLEFGTPIDEVVRLGGWQNERVVRKHYERHREEARARHAEAWNADDTDHDVTELSKLKKENARMRAILEVNGIDWMRPVEPIQLATRSRSASGRSTRHDSITIMQAVVATAASGGSPSLVLRSLGLSTAKKNYERLATVCAEQGVPPLSNGRQLPDARHQEQVAEWQQILMNWADGSEGRPQWPGECMPIVPNYEPRRVLRSIIEVVEEGGHPSLILAKLGLTSSVERLARVAAVCQLQGVPTLSNGRQFPETDQPDQLAEWHQIVKVWAGKQQIAA